MASGAGNPNHAAQYNQGEGCQRRQQGQVTEPGGYAGGLGQERAGLGYCHGSLGGNQRVINARLAGGEPQARQLVGGKLMGVAGTFRPSLVISAGLGISRLNRPTGSSCKVT